MRYIVFLVIVCLMAACKTTPEKAAPNALDTGRQFIRASLDGDFKAAEPLILDDSVNLQQFMRFETFYSAMPEEDRNKYKSASYEINKFLEVSDSVTIINYSNSFMKKPMEVKLVKIDRAWKVDFKYTNSGNLPID